MHLAPSPNDIAFPYGRLKALLLPWSDGAPAPVNLTPRAPFVGYPNLTYFWDTVCYIGWLPILATAFPAMRAIILRRRPDRPWAFIAVLGILSLLLAFPFWQQLMSHLPGTFFRSPARQIYLTSFA